jgi:hypothetical protein
MKTVLIDASSAILLYKVELFDLMVQVHALAVSASVFQELTVPARCGAAAFDRAYRNGAIQRIDIRTEGSGSGPSWAAGLGEGERDTLLAYELIRADFIILDDRRGVRCCRDRQVPHINALLCPLTLYSAGRISADQCRHFFDRLTAVGRYSRTVVEYARQCTTDSLIAFQPAPPAHDKIHSVNN